MDMLVGNRRVTKIIAGGQVIYDRRIQESSWIECPDVGTSDDFKTDEYLLLAKYNDAEKTMTIQNGSRFSGNYTSRATDHLVLTLPKGFVFDEGNPTTGEFYDPQSGSNYILQCPLTYKEGQMFANFRMMYTNGGNFFYRPETTSKGTSIFKVKRSDK